jgi:hypothetical protein
VLPYPHTTERSRELRGTVLDARTLAPIQGAKVVQSERRGAPPGKTRTRITDAAGRFTLTATHNFHLAAAGPEGADWPRGHQYELVTIVCSNYLAHEIEGWGELRVLLQPARPLNLSGRIFDSRTNASLQGARVCLSDFPSLSSISDATGHFRLIATDSFDQAYEASEAAGTPFGDWVNATHPNYLSITFHGTAERDVLLKPKP